MYLNIGDSAPDFTLKNYNGKDITLKQLTKQDFILWFFPKANTPG
jgi:peroxiredoxin Q/BCP